MIRIIKNTSKHIIFEKDNKEELWFNNKCSNEDLLIHCNRPNDVIKSIKWEDGKYTASLLNIYFN
jgi:hypothetical protein